MTLNEFLGGRSHYVAQTPWPPVRAIAATLLIFISAQAAAAAVFAASGMKGRFGLGNPDAGADPTGMLMQWLLLTQVVMIGLVWCAANMFRGRFREVLQLRPVAGGGVTFLYAVLAMAVLLGSFNAFVYWLKADNMLDDMLPYLQLLRGEGWWIAALAIGAGAPIMEELIFRGFLLSALAKSRLGFWPAAVAATSAWTMLHWGYSATGLAEVFLVGLYFSWLVWRTGSLWPAIACHALYNSSLVVFMRYAPIPT